MWAGHRVGLVRANAFDSSSLLHSNSEILQPVDPKPKAWTPQGPYLGSQSQPRTSTGSTGESITNAAGERCPSLQISWEGSGETWALLPVSPALPLSLSPGYNKFPVVARKAFPHSLCQAWARARQGWEVGGCRLDAIGGSRHFLSQESDLMKADARLQKAPKNALSGSRKRRSGLNRRETIGRRGEPL